MADKILKSFDVWIAAQGVKSRTRLRSVDNISLQGIDKLRELILDLAVWGRLGTQDIKDEPAQLIIDKITKNKKKLIDEGRLRKQLLDIEYRGKVILPSGWSWANIPQVTKNEKYAIKRGPFGSSLRKDFFVSSGYKIYEQQHAIQDDFSLGEYYIDEKKFNELSAFEVKPGDIIISCSGTVGKVAEAPAWMEPGVINQALLKLSLNQDAVLNNYFKILFPSFFMKTETLSNLQGTAQKNMVSTETLQTEPFPLPPLAEQHRIVAKVDELMALCDELEKQETQHLKSHTLLVETLLGTLTQARDAKEFLEAWTLLSKHFDDLFTTEDSIDQLKQTILQLAIMGKLVPQDPKDEPASVLLERIVKEKERLMKEHGLRTHAENTISENEKYLQIPAKWEYCRLGNIFKFIDYRGRTPEKLTSGIRLITAKNVKLGYISLDPEEFISETDYDEWMTRGIPKVNDLLFTTEAPLGNVALLNIDEKIALAQRIICLQPHIYDVSPFLKTFMLSGAFQKVLLANATGMTATGIKASKLKEVPIAMPPLNEQQRIVSKVNELFAMCDRLKERITEAQKLANQMAEAVVGGCRP